MKTRDIVRITIEFTDGSVDMLEGLEAAKWEEAVDGQAVFCSIHGVQFPELAWTHVRGPTLDEP